MDSCQIAESVEDIYEIAECLCSNETRYHSRTSPMTMLMAKGRIDLAVLEVVSADPNPIQRHEARWASVIVEAT